MRLRLRRRAAAVAAAAALVARPAAAQPAALPAALPNAPVDTAWVRAHYRKLEARVPMRDGVRLFTSVYVPRDTAGKRFPVLMTRTPYSAQPYGPDAYRASLGPSGNPRYARDGYIFVVQDVRGRWMSEGDFTSMSPHNPAKRGRDTDETTDTHDTIRWLLANVRPNNGRVAIYGTSWPGFYATASCIDAPPALVACSPQAPMTDVWMGDDNFHNGAFLLAHNFGFFSRFGRPAGAPPGLEQGPRVRTGPDAYKWYLALGPVGPGARARIRPDSGPLWYELAAHPAYDAFNQARDISRHVRGMRPAMLVVGGLFDTEDLQGPWRTWRAVERLTPNNRAQIVVGPWSHGGWSRGDANVLGVQRFGAPTGPFFRDSVEYPFFAHHLKGGPDPRLAEATVFETGANRWRRFAQFPPPEAARRTLYLHPGGRLAFTPPPAARGDSAFDRYVSDPARPVPTVDRVEPQGMPRDYITGDQRFASRRPDVLTYVSDVLTKDVTVAGPVSPRLHVATSGTDADFMVKLIDVQPDTAPNWPGDSSGFVRAGAEFLIRGEPFRARYRRSWERPVAFTPNQPDSLAFDMPDVLHTFRRGHRIMVQVQSTWFPFIDRNPQTFVPNIFEARPEDFRAAEMRVYREAARPSRVEVLTLP